MLSFIKLNTTVLPLEVIRTRIGVLGPPQEAQYKKILASRGRSIVTVVFSIFHYLVIENVQYQLEYI